MKYIISAVIFLGIFTSVVHAESMYISDTIRITLRSGPGTDHKIIQMINTGQPVEALQDGDDWSQVRLSNGLEGWILKRFLSKEKPKSLIYASLEEEHEQITSQLASLHEKNFELTAENQKLTSSLNNSNEKLHNIKNAYDTLKKESSDFFNLKAKYAEATGLLTEQTEKVEKLEKELLNKYITAGLCGAGVLLLGFILGSSARRQRRSSLYSL